MRRWLAIALLLSVVSLSVLISGGVFHAEEPARRTEAVVKGSFSVWAVYAGRIEARNVETVMSRLGSGATVVELAPEGTQVSAGNVLVRFDASEHESGLMKLERDHSLAQAEFESLEQATLPLEMRTLEQELAKARSKLGDEERYLAACRELAEESLVGRGAVAQQVLTVAEAQAELDGLEQKAELTRRYLHPSQIKRAQARLAAAVQELDRAREQIAASVVRAPAGGMVVYSPLHLGGEYRAARVGDTVYPNQVLMVLPDMRELVVRLEVPEDELSQVHEGGTAVVRTLAYPDLPLQGAVETVGSMAHQRAERPRWQRFFHVTIALRETDPRLRPGMSATAHVLSYSAGEAVLVPRAAIRWERDAALATVITRGSQSVRELVLGQADDTHYEVLDGLSPGEEVLVE